MIGEPFFYYWVLGRLSRLVKLVVIDDLMTIWNIGRALASCTKVKSSLTQNVCEIKPLADPRGTPGTAASPSKSIFPLHADFLGEFLADNRLARQLLGLSPQPPSGKPWIRYCVAKKWNVGKFNPTLIRYRLQGKFHFRSV